MKREEYPIKIILERRIEMPQYVIIEKARLLQRETPTPEHPVPVEKYIKITNMGWYKAVTDARELELLGDEKQ